MSVLTISVEAETLTPFANHSLMAQNDTATLPELIGDRAVAFGLAMTLRNCGRKVSLTSARGASGRSTISTRRAGAAR